MIEIQLSRATGNCLTTKTSNVDNSAELLYPVQQKVSMLYSGLRSKDNHMVKTLHQQAESTNKKQYCLGFLLELLLEKITLKCSWLCIIIYGNYYHHFIIVISIVILIIVMVAKNTVVEHLYCNCSAILAHCSTENYGTCNLSRLKRTLFERPTIWTHNHQV